MQCEQCQKWIMLLDAGERDDRHRGLTQRHMAQCAACRDFKNTLQTLRTIVREEVCEPSEFTMQRLQQVIHAETAHAGLRPRRWLGFLKIAALLAILLAGARLSLQWRRPASDGDSAPALLATPVTDDFSSLELLLTDRVVELHRFDDLVDPRLTPLEMEIMLLEGLAI